MANNGMTLVEFLAAVRGGSRKVQISSVLYWYEHYQGRAAMTVGEVKAALLQARVPGAKTMNVADAFLKSGASVDTKGNNENGVKLWELTETGRSEVRRLHGLPEDEPEVEHGVSELRKVAQKINDASVRAYVDEAILALSVGALRAAIVFMWVAAVREVQDQIWANGAPAVNASLAKYAPNVKSLKKQDDLAEIKESTLLLMAQDLGVLDKAQKLMLEQSLNTRNQCGHPNNYSPGVAKAKSHIEDIVGILFT
jgi:hypothetical protein